MRGLRPEGTRAGLMGPRSLIALTLGLGLLLLFTCFGHAKAQADVTCPNSNPVVNENQCKTGTSAWRGNEEDSPDLGGFTTQTSVNLGEAVTLKIARNGPVSPTKTATISVYRMGYYEGLGGRLVNSATKVAINNNFTCEAMDPTTGKVSCANWAPTYTIPGSAFPASGVYLAVVSASTGEETQIVFTVRDDKRTPKAKILYVLPIATYEAYNTFGGKSLYFGTEGENTVSGSSRAVKVSFDRPFNRAGGYHDWFFGPDFDLLSWMERQGYDVSYTDDVHLQENPAELKEHGTIVVSGHSEYWSLAQFNGFLAARNAGINIASFSSNTAYWKVRYENGNRTLVCYKTIEGNGSEGTGTVSANDWGPDGIKGTADDALGADGIAGTADDNPQNSTTTFRDNGAPPGDPNAPPGGRVGPDMPENQLFGIMYVGDNDARSFPVTVPPGNGNEEFASNRLWRNTGISQNSTTNIGSGEVNWEWDTIPTQAQYLSHEPSGVKRLYATNVQAANDNSWIQDEGRLRNTQPPPGQPGTIGGATYTAPSGAMVFASGAMEWSYGLSSEVDPRIEQVTYNVLSDMGNQPGTPEDVTLDPSGSNRPPSGSFTISPNPTKTAKTVTFDASASLDPDGTIAKYEWDLDGDGTFETSSGSNPKVTHAYLAEGEFDVRLRVTDNKGATDLSVQTIKIIDNQPPTASFKATPTVSVIGEPVVLDGSASSDPDGTIAKYEWDLDGNGSYETNGGSSPTLSHAYEAKGTYNVGLRVVDNGGKTATATLPITVNKGGVSNYSTTVLGTPGLVHYWRMGEISGTTFADSAGSSPATAEGGVTMGVSGGVPEDPDRAAHFDGINDSASAHVDLSGTNAVTVEFWLKHEFANDDHIAMELTGSYHENPGGFLIDPDAPQFGGQFAVGIGREGSRNTAYFERPSSGVWHHYAFVLDSSAPAEQQIIPYVDGERVPFTKPENGTGAGNFANSTLYMMSRGAGSLFGEGDLDEVALYNRALSGAEISEQFNSDSTNGRPLASFQAPASAKPGQQVSFDASASKDPDGTIAKYEWDLDGNGTYETNTGTTPTVNQTYATEGKVNVSLRVTDNEGATGVVTHTISIGQNQPPAAAFSATPNPAATGEQINFDASASSDPDGTIAKYEWDLDGNGSYETSTGTTPTVNHAYSSPGEVAVGLRVTDNLGATTTATRAVNIAGEPVSYSDAVRETPGLLDYWRMGDASGTTLADSAGSSPASTTGGPTLGVPGGVRNDSDTAVRFDGNDDAASAALNLSSKSAVTLEFWMKWNAWANDDKLAFEYTPNFNDGPGGFLVDPNSSYGNFAVALGNGASRNIALFSRPTAGAWHHYAFVLDTTAPAGQQVIPYVDGQAVAFTKPASGTEAGNFANSSLYFMSRSGSALFGAGDLDEVALYGRALDAGTIAQHFQSFGANRRPTASFQIPGFAQPGQQVSFDASASKDPDGTIAKYEWDLDGNGTYETNTGTTPTVNQTYATEGKVNVSLRVTDNLGSSATTTRTLTVAKNQPPKAALSASPNPGVAGQPVTLDASASSDPDGTIAKYEWDLDGNGSYETDTGATATVSHSYSTAGDVNVGLRITDDLGATATTSRTLSVAAGQEIGYSEAVSKTPGLLDYWRMGEIAGSTFADSAGSSPATAAGGVTLGVAGALPKDLDRAATFDGNIGAASAALSLSSESAVTLEFWMKWNAWANDDKLAFEYTPNFNDGPGGFLVDPNSSYGNFAVALGVGESRNVALFSRPSAGAWHHYAFVLDTTAPADQEIVPYVDGQPVAFTKAGSGTGAGNFANSTLNFMSRNGSALFGAGDLDEVALYGRALEAGTIAQHYNLIVENKAPAASFTATPNPVQTHNPVSFDASASNDPDGTVAKYEWDLDGNGSYETNTGTTPTVSQSYLSKGSVDVGLRVTDNRGSSATTTRAVTVQNSPPSASFTASPGPTQTAEAVNFDASASSDPDGPIAKYEWDLDGNGSYETNTGATATTSQAYATPGNRTIGLRVTDGDGATATTTQTVAIQNRAPSASFTATPNPAVTGEAVTFDASASSDPDGTVAKYEWDLDGNGSYETSTGTTASASNTYAAQGSVTVGLRVTDDNGATATTTQAVTIQNHSPAAAFTATPNPAPTGATVSFNGSASKDPDGTVAKYEWDLDGNGSYETNTGATATTSQAYTTSGARTVGLRVTDNEGATATTTQTVTIQNRAPAASFTATPSTALSGTPVAFNGSASSDPDGTVAQYEWDLDGNGSYETNTGTTPTVSQTYATPGNRTVGLRVTDNEGATATTTRTVTIQNRAPTASFTATPNPVVSGSSVAFNGSASKDPDGTIAKYEWDLDGNGSYETNTGATATASQAYATPGNRTVGLRVTDNSGTTATTSVVLTVQNRAPTAAFTFSPNPALSNATITFDASTSKDPDGTIAKYEWDLDGNGSYETNGGTKATTTHVYTTVGARTIGLRITDNSGATTTTSQSVNVQNSPPTASFTATPNPVAAGATVTLNAAASSDPDGAIAKYEWDLDGNGSYETNGAAKNSTTRSFPSAGEYVVGLRVTDAGGATATTTRTVTVRGPYNAAVSATSGLIDYWRLGEPSGTTLADSVGGHNATAQNGVTLGVASPLTLDPNTAASFDGSNDSASAALNLSGTNRLTIEFWLNWTTFANDDKLAFEFTPNFNNTNGGFLINPNSSTSGGKFEVALGRNGTRNNAYFTRPSAGAWHHYAIVLNTSTILSAQVITVYVDGKAVSVTKGSSGILAGNFANSTLNFMSRAGSSLFGKGSLDEVSIYEEALTATQIAQHYAAR
jgi:PKD repeat protein